jgi:hypothetical protein
MVDSINIDKTAPKVVVTGVAASSKYELSSVPTPGCDTTDALSQVQTAATVAVTGTAAPSGVGSFTAKCSGATDQAGNTATEVTATYSVTYGAAFRGVMQPINADGSSIFSGKVIPVKVRITDYYGNPVPDAVARVYFAVVTGAVTGTEQEAVPVANTSGDAGNLMRYDAAADQYIFNWDVSGLANGTYQVRVELGEGKCGEGHVVTLSLSKRKK